MNEVLNAAMRLLARREHGAEELTIKLCQKGHQVELITKALIECQRLGLQSDSRFAEALCRQRINQGYGPVKIKQDLSAKHLARDLIEQTLAQIQIDWSISAEEVRKKKFKHSKGLTFAERQKQQRFLLYRGFPIDIISRLFL